MFNTVVDFTGKYNLTQLSLEAQDINDVIDVEERRLLKAIMGSHEFKLLEDNLDVDGNPTTQPYIDLVEGDTTYIVTDQNNIEHEFEWDGINQFLKGFCYYAVTDWQKTFNTGSGEVELMGSETTSSAVNKTTRLRNEAAVIVGKDLRKYTTGCKTGIVDVSKYYINERNYNWFWEHSLENTFFNYMNSNIDKFPKWTFKQQDILLW